MLWDDEARGQDDAAKANKHEKISSQPPKPRSKTWNNSVPHSPQK